MPLAQIRKKLRQPLVDVVHAYFLHHLQTTPDTDVLDALKKECVDALHDRSRTELQIGGDLRLKGLAELVKGQRPYQNTDSQDQREEGAQQGLVDRYGHRLAFAHLIPPAIGRHSTP